MPVSHLDFFLRVMLALILGSVVGVERQWRQRMAGLRTNALVAIGASLFVLITPLIGETTTRTQIAAYVVSGIGFLAGGVIFKERLSISGLNTAATLWCTAAIGSLVGLGYLIEATIGVIAIIFANVLLRPVAHAINSQPTGGTEVVTSYEIRAICRLDAEESLRSAMIAAIRKENLGLNAVYSDQIEGTDRAEIVADVTILGKKDSSLERIVSRIGIGAGISGVSWKLVPTNDDEREMLSES